MTQSPLGWMARESLPGIDLLLRIRPGYCWFCGVLPTPRIREVCLYCVIVAVVQIRRTKVPKAGRQRAVERIQIHRATLSVQRTSSVQRRGRERLWQERHCASSSQYRATSSIQSIARRRPARRRSSSVEAGSAYGKKGIASPRANDLSRDVVRSNLSRDVVRPPSRQGAPVARKALRLLERNFTK